MLTPSRRTPASQPAARPLLDGLEPRTLLATFALTSLGDTSGDDGVLTLREAVAQANAAAGTDEITFDGLPAGTITLTQGELAITDELVISGPGRAALTIDAADASRVFSATAALTLLDLTLANGRATDAGGGAIVATAGLVLERVTIRDSIAPQTASPTSEGGAVLASGNATLRDVTLENNSSERSGGAMVAIGDVSHTLVLERVEAFGNDALQTGGALVATGYASITISDSSFTGNSATSRGGAARLHATTVTITGSTFATNSSRTSHGGHLALDFGDVTITGSTFEAGRADTDDADDGRGGAIDAAEAVSALEISGSTFDGNEADLGGAVFTFPFASNLVIRESSFTANDADEGGAMYLADGTGSGLVDRALFASNVARLGGAIYAADQLEVRDSTLSGNTARRDGGALYVATSGVEVNYSTIAFNRADTSNSGTGEGGGVFATATFDLLSSIVALNYRGSSGQTVDAIAGTANASFSITGDVDPGLDALADNGGPTRTHALKAASPAVGAGPTSSGLVDQRDMSRPSSSPIDIGAFQHFAPEVASLDSADGTGPRGGALVATATGSDPDGELILAEFYVDLNSNGTIDDGELVAEDDDLTDGASATLPTTGFAVGQTLRFFVIVYDLHGFASEPAEQTVTIVNSLPLVGSLSSSSPALVGGGSITLTAGEVIDADGSVLSVSFYRDANENGQPDTGELISTDSTPGDGFTAVLDAADVPLGTFTVLAVATDNDGDTGEPASLDLVRGERPVIGSVAILTARPMQGQQLRLSVRDVTDPDAETITVRVYADRNLDGIADATELLGSGEVAPGEDVVITLSAEAVDSILPGARTLLIVATDDQGAPSETFGLDLQIGFDTRAGTESDLAGSADGAGVHRALVINGYGVPIVYEQTAAGFVSFRLDSAAGLSGVFETITFTGGVELWTDPRDGLTYAATTTDAGLYLFVRSAGGVWAAIDLAEIEGAEPIEATLTRFTSTDGVVTLAGFTVSGRLVAFTRASSTGDQGADWAFTDISAQTGSPIDGLSSLTSYVTAWNQWSIVGLDADGAIQNFWFIPGVHTAWNINNLSEITGAPALSGGLSPILTSWQGINLTALDADGNLLVTWWVPSFEGEWVSDDLTEIADGPAFADGAMTSYYTSWDGMNYAGIDEEGRLVVYWWVPATNAWAASPLAEIETEPGTGDRAGPIRLDGSAAADGTLAVFLIDGLSNAQRVWWQPGQGATWTIDSLSEAPSI